MHKLKPINVALNGRFSGVTQPTGTQTVAFHLFDAIIRSPREITITAFADTRFPGIEEWATTPNTRVIHVPFRDWSRAKSQLWEQFLFSSLAKKHGCHLLHYPITTCSRWFQSLPSIVTVHDLNFHTHPEWFATPFRLWMKYAAIPGIRRSTRIVTVSDYVLKEVQQHLSIPTEKLTRIYNGVKPFPPLSPTSTADTPPYLLCVGSLQPHKNLRRLIEAFFIAKKHQPDLQLHIVGRPQKGFNDVIEKDAYRTQKDIHFLGYLDEETLARTYQNARVFCYPSLEEGFGLPVLEAMAMHHRGHLQRLLPP